MKEELNYREQYIRCCQFCLNVSENNTCMGTTYNCQLLDFEEVSANGICDKIDCHL